MKQKRVIFEIGLSPKQCFGFEMSEKAIQQFVDTQITCCYSCRMHQPMYIQLFREATVVRIACVAAHFILCFANSVDAAQDVRCSTYTECLSAAEGGNLSAQFFVGFAFLTGNMGVIQDRKVAESWFRKAATNGHLKAMEFYGAILLCWDYPADCIDAPLEHKVLGFWWLSKSAEGGNPGAIYGLGRIYTEGLGGYTSESRVYKEVVGVDERRAFELLSRATELGLVDAKYQLGKMYIYGRGTAVDAETGWELLEQAARDGSENARSFLDALEYGQSEKVFEQ